MTKAYWVPEFADKKSVVHYLFRLPKWLSVGASFQHEASGDYYIRRGERRPDTLVQGEWMKRLDGTNAYFGKDIRRGMISLEEHRRRFLAANRTVNILGHAGLGNVTMNPFYLAWARGHLGYSDLDLPNLQNDYAFAGLVIHEDWHAEYHDDIHFGYAQNTPTGVPIYLGKSDESSRIRFAIVGPTIARNGAPIDEADLRRQVLAGEHYDLRHVMLFPHLQWNKKKDTEIPQDPADIISFCPLLEAMWSNGTLNPTMVDAVFNHSPISVSTEPYDKPDLPYVGRIGHTIGTQAVVDSLVGRGYVPIDGLPSEVGEFSLSGPTANQSYHTLQAQIRPGIYNFSALGITATNELIWGCTTGLGGRVGITVCQMGKLMVRAGCTHAILLDQGGDVSVSLGERQIVQSSYGRQAMRGILFFADPAGGHNASDLGLPESTSLEMGPIKDLNSWTG